MIAYPIGDPIGSYRVRLNRPRIARIESCRVSPLKYIGHLALFTTDAAHSPAPFAGASSWEAMR